MVIFVIALSQKILPACPLFAVGNLACVQAILEEILPPVRKGLSH